MDGKRETVSDIHNQIFARDTNKITSSLPQIKIPSPSQEEIRRAKSTPHPYTSFSFLPEGKAFPQSPLLPLTPNPLYAQWASSTHSGRNTSSTDSSNATRGAKNAPPSPRARSTSTVNTSTPSPPLSPPRARNPARASATTAAKGGRIGCLSLRSRRSFLLRRAAGRGRVGRIERAGVQSGVAGAVFGVCRDDEVYDN